MNIKAKTNLKKNIVNFFGAFGYLSCAMQWLWAIALNFILIKALASLISPTPNRPIINKAPVVANSSPDIFVIVFGIIITVTIVLLTIYILIKIPSTIVKTSKNVVHKTAENITPIVLQVQHKKDSKRNRIKLSFRIILFIKAMLVVIPLIFSFTSQFTEKQMIDFHISIQLGLWLAGFSVIFFAFQYILANLLLVKKQDLW